MYEFIRVERENALTIITINRPAVHNAGDGAPRGPGGDLQHLTDDGQLIQFAAMYSIGVEFSWPTLM
jgi:hypothetical protein